MKILLVVLLSAMTAFGQATVAPAGQAVKAAAGQAAKPPAAKVSTAQAAKAPAGEAAKASTAQAAKAPATPPAKAPAGEAAKAPAGQSTKAPAAPATKAPAGQAAKAPAAPAAKAPAGQAAKAPAAQAPKPAADQAAKAPASPASSGPVQGPPPKNLTKQSDGHISANPVPANPDKFVIHDVVAGETLSQISEVVLKDSRLWPQLWEMNEHIVNPHWIYPDDKILIRPITKITEAVPPPPPTAPTAVAAATPEPAAAPAPTPAPPPEPPAPPAPKPDPRGAAVLRPLLTVPVTAQPKVADVFTLPTPRRAPVVKATDIYCSGFIRDTPVPNSLRVASVDQRESAVLSAEGQYVRLNSGSGGGVAVGSTYQVIRPTKRIDNKFGSGAARNLGTHYLDVGQIRVVQVQADSALARVTGNCEAVEVGDVLLAFVRIDVPELPGNRPFSSTMTTSGKLKGSVVLMKSTVVSPGLAQHTSAFFTNAGMIDAEGGVVYIDIGKGDGVKTGDLFIVYHGKVAVGEITVLKADEKASSALVTYSADVFVPGDRVEQR